jgi:hypothetical protein
MTAGARAPKSWRLGWTLAVNSSRLTLGFGPPFFGQLPVTGSQVPSSVIIILVKPSGYGLISI